MTLRAHNGDTTGFAGAREPGSRIQQIRTMAGYGAALAVTPYLLIKIL